MAPTRVHIVGGPGSGKTTLARRLSRELALPAFDLDRIGYENGAGAKRPLGARRADIQEITGSGSWIAEGIFLWWTDDLLRHAEVIVWLDVPWRVAAWRILRRHVVASLRGVNRHKGLRRLWRFLRHARRYYHGPAVTPAALDDDAAVTRAATAAVLAPFHDKVVRCRCAADLNHWVSEIRRDGRRLSRISSWSSRSG